MDYRNDFLMQDGTGGNSTTDKIKQKGKKCTALLNANYDTQTCMQQPGGQLVDLLAYLITLVFSTTLNEISSSCR